MENKIRVEGLTFSMQGFVGTIAAGIVTAVIGWVLNFSKYDGTLSFADTQAGSAVFAIKLLFIAVPFVVGVLNIILLNIKYIPKFRFRSGSIVNQGNPFGSLFDPAVHLLIPDFHGCYGSCFRSLCIN